jgi:hypothetical protein
MLILLIFGIEVGIVKRYDGKEIGNKSEISMQK